MLAVHKIVLRYKTLDECFRSQKKWTLEELIVLCSNVLEEKISKRSIQADIQFLRDNNAPIIVTDKKYYTYSDKKFSFLKSEIPEKLEQQFSECIDFIKIMQLFPRYSSCFKSDRLEKNSDIHYVKFQKDEFLKKGFFISEDFYTKSELRKIEKYIKTSDKNILLDENGKLLTTLLNENLKKLLKKIDNRVFLVDAIWNNTQISFDFQQKIELPMTEREIPKNLTLWGYPATENYEKVDKKSLYEHTFAIQIFLKNTDEKTGALQLVQGSHQRELSPLEISLITNNTTPSVCNVKKGGIVVYKPMLIQKICPSESPKLKPSITLYFSSYALPVHYIWNNKIEI
ncbi:MAG: hypothetical protein KGV44_15165 [Flavobacteriaceae bacterium]|nr:hypothetical protein [Flavobacteriaceae bacterium]